MTGSNRKTRRNARPATRAHVRSAPAEQQPQAVIQLAHRAKCRTDTGNSRPLMQRQRRGHMQHFINSRLPRLGQTAPRIRRERLEIPARPLRIQHAQSQGAFTRAGHPRDTHQFVQRNIDIYVLQVMHARSANLDHRRVIQISHSPSANPEAFSSPVDASIPSWLEYKHMFYLFSPNNYSSLGTQGSTNGTEEALWNTSLKTITCGTSPSRGRC